MFCGLREGFSQSTEEGVGMGNEEGRKEWAMRKEGICWNGQ